MVIKSDACYTPYTVDMNVQRKVPAYTKSSKVHVPVNRGHIVAGPPVVGAVARPKGPRPRAVIRSKDSMGGQVLRSAPPRAMS